MIHIYKVKICTRTELRTRTTDIAILIHDLCYIVSIIIGFMPDACTSKAVTVLMESKLLMIVLTTGSFSMVNIET